MKKHAAGKQNPGKDEKQFLDTVSATYAVGKSSFDLVMRRLFVRTIQPFIPRGVGLELGCSDGFMTELLAKRLDRLDVIDGSKKFLNNARKRGISNARFIYALFEEFNSDERYDIVFATYVLEHVIDVQAVLKMVHRVLKKDGFLYVVVPNAFALSRQLARHMDLLPELHHLTPNDHRHGHRRVYDRVALDRDLRAGNFKIVSQGGIFLKPLADFQMDKLLDNNIIADKQIEGLYRLGKQYPDLCGCLYALCRAVP